MFMPSASRSSNAYKLQPSAVRRPAQPKKTETARQKTKNLKTKAKGVRRKLVSIVAAVFIIQLFLCSRWVTLYGLHNEIEQQTLELSRIQRENEQTVLEIDSLADASRVEQYAKNELGMRKIESSQIVYVQPMHGDSMQKVAKKNAGSSKRGIFGALSSTLDGALEYLR